MKKVVSLVLLALYLSFTVGTLSSFKEAGEHFCAAINNAKAYSLEEKSGKHCEDLHVDAFGSKHVAKHMASVAKIKVPPFSSASLVPASLVSATSKVHYFIKPSPLFDQSSIYLTNCVLLL